GARLPARAVPTRRSSDLGLQSIGHRAGGEALQRGLYVFGRGAGAVVALQALVQPGGIEQVAPGGFGRRQGQPRFAGDQVFEQVRQDRKSTRLNSSHVKISYAVFCLKKKNKTKQTTS